LSHFRTLRTKLTDAEVLIATLRELGIYAQINANVRGFNSQQVQADIVAVLEGEQDIGWSRNANGSFDMIADLPGVARENDLNKLLGLINQKYAVNKTLAQVKQSGLQNANVLLVLQE
jgi:hypothetical protein